MKYKRIMKTFTMHLQRSAKEVFPLLCPVREYEWIQPWQCSMVYTESGTAELDCIFKTNFPEDGPEDTWIVSRYEIPKIIEFVRVNHLRVIRYTIHCMGEEEKTSTWIWEQIITALSPEGNEFTQSLTDEAYITEMKMLEKMLNHFLETGKMLPLN